MAFIPAAAAAIGSAIGSISGGSLLSAGGAVLGGISALAAGNYQKQVADMNATIAKDNAARAKERAQVNQQNQDAATLGMLGEQEAAQSASGISLTSRSAIATRKSARQLGRLDALNIRQAGEIEAYNYQVDAANQKSAGQFAQSEGQLGLLGSFFKAGGSLVGNSSSTSTADKITGGSSYGLLAKKRDPWAGMRTVTV